MSTTPQQPSSELGNVVRQLPNAQEGTIDSFDVKGGEGFSEKVVDAIEMIGEETAAGMPPPAPKDAAEGQVTPAMRYLHCSRTIHQLVTDRNRAVGLFLGVASLLITASGVIYNANPAGDLIIPIQKIQRWCFPLTFAALTVLSVLIAFMLIRTRVGLIYEVAKMNALLGLPVGRVQRIAPLSIFFIMQAIISLAGGACGGLCSVYLIYLVSPQGDHHALWGTLIGTAIAVGLLLLYVVTVNHITSDQRLQQAGK